MRFHNVCIEALGYSLPNEVISSAEIERRLEPLYERLRLPEGRLELMSGIRERRIWPAGMLPSEQSIASGRRALDAAQFDPARVGLLMHASVCRDHLEPATACRVHHELRLPHECLVYDVSNACLGLINGALQAAAMIELGQISAGLVVGTEDSRHLLETTIDALNRDHELTRDTVKPAVASLTIGSASCAILLVRRDLSRTGNRLLGAAFRANTTHHDLCHSGRDEAVADGMRPLMTTDSETLMREGIATGAETFVSFLSELNWSRDNIDKTCCHQVGSAHRKLMLEVLQVSAAHDFTTFSWLGNTGSVALPVTAAIAATQGHLQENDNLALLGIGSGINCLMLAANWQRSVVAGNAEVIGPQL